MNSPSSKTLVERLRAYTTFDPVGGIKRQIVDDFIEAANAIEQLRAKVARGCGAIEALRDIAEECEYAACSLSPAEIAKMARDGLARNADEPAAALRIERDQLALLVKTLECERDAWRGSSNAYKAEAERASQSPLADQDGPGEEDGPWAEGWEQRASLPPTALTPEVDSLLCDVSQLLDGWKQTAPQHWTDWDQGVRDQITLLRTTKPAQARLQMGLLCERPCGHEGVHRAGAQFWSDRPTQPFPGLASTRIGMDCGRYSVVLRFNSIDEATAAQEQIAISVMRAPETKTATCADCGKGGELIDFNGRMIHDVCPVEKPAALDSSRCCPANTPEHTAKCKAQNGAMCSAVETGAAQMFVDKEMILTNTDGLISETGACICGRAIPPLAKRWQHDRACPQYQAWVDDR